MLTLFRPRLRSWEDRVAVQTDSSLAFSSGVRTPRRRLRPAASRGTIGFLPLQVIGLGPGAEVRERRRAFLHPGDQPAGAERRAAGGVHLHLDDVARLGHRRPGGGAGEDDVALFEGEQLGQIGHEPGEREEQVLRGVVLDQLAVVPRADRAVWRDRRRLPRSGPGPPA